MQMLWQIWTGQGHYRKGHAQRSKFSFSFDIIRKIVKILNGLAFFPVVCCGFFFLIILQFFHFLIACAWFLQHQPYVFSTLTLLLSTFWPSVFIWFSLLMGIIFPQVFLDELVWLIHLIQKLIFHFIKNKGLCFFPHEAHFHCWSSWYIMGQVFCFCSSPLVGPLGNVTSGSTVLTAKWQAKNKTKKVNMKKRWGGIIFK